MDKKEFLKILQNPAQLNNDKLFELEEFIQEYPYFQSVKVLYLKILKDQNSFRYNQQLKTTAIYTTDRSVLFDFITSDIFHNPDIAEEEKKIIQEIELRDEIIIEKLKAQENEKEDEIEELNPDENLLEFDLPKNQLQDEEPVSENLNQTEETNTEQKDPDYEDFVKEIDKDIALLLSNDSEVPETDGIVENKETELENFSESIYIADETPPDESSQIAETAQDIAPIFNQENTEPTETEDRDLDIPQEAESSDTDKNEATANSGSIEIFIEEEEEEEEEETEKDEDDFSSDIQPEAGNIIDKAFTITNEKLGETYLQQGDYLYPKKEKQKNKKPIDFTEPVDPDASDKIYKSILKNPALYDEEKQAETTSAHSDSAVLENVIFEIATDEAVHDINPEIKPSSTETNISSTQTTAIFFEPVTETSDQKDDEALDDEPILDLDIQKPKNFNKNESHSFAEWMQLSSFKPIDRSKEPPKDEKDKKMALINEFMTKNPKIKPDKNIDFSVDFEEVENFDGKTIMTETLAQIYTKQHKYDSAIKAYEILSLKFPEKSSFFADQISSLKKLKRTNSSD